MTKIEWNGLIIGDIDDADGGLGFFATTFDGTESFHASEEDAKDELIAFARLDPDRTRLQCQSYVEYLRGQREYKAALAARLELRRRKQEAA